MSMSMSMSMSISMMWTAHPHAPPPLLDPSSSSSSSSSSSLLCDTFCRRSKKQLSSISHGGRPRRLAITHCTHGFFSPPRISCEANDGQKASYIQELSTRSSAMEVRKELLLCYELIQQLGKGVVYLGSSRTKQDHPHFLQAVELGRKVATLLDCTTWTGVGPGLMDAVVKGALQSGKPVGGFKISREAGEWTSSSTHPYLDKNAYVTCRFFSARKHGLVDAAVRDHSHEKTAFVALPGGIGTVDEIFEILALIQLGRLGSKYPVPFLLINYDGFYTKLLEFLTTCKAWGSVAEGEVENLWTICENNEEALEHLSAFYNIQNPDIKNA